MKEEKDMTADREPQNAREPLPQHTDAWAGPFKADNPTEYEINGERDVVEILDAAGKVFAVVLADDCDEHVPEAVARATHIANLLNRQQQPAQAEVPMADMPPVDARTAALLDDTLVVGTVMALAQSLKAMGDAEASAGREGHAVVARRAERFVRVMGMHVTRFLKQVDLRLRHGSLDFDLLAAHVDVSDTGKVMVGCTDLEGSGWHQLPLEELVAAGPISDVVRFLINELGRVQVQDAIGQLIESGNLPGFDTFQQAKEEARANEMLAPGGDANPREFVGVDMGKLGGDQTVLAEVERSEDGRVMIHRLDVYPEYVLGQDGHAEAVGFEPPEVDEAFGANGS